MAAILQETGVAQLMQDKGDQYIISVKKKN